MLNSMTRRFGVSLCLLMACSGAVQAHSASGASAPAAAAPAAAAEDSPDAADESAFDWDFSWQDWQGLSFYASHKTNLDAKVSFMPIVDLDELRFGGSIGGRIEVDGAGFDTNGSLTGFDSGVQLRRARFTARGASQLGVPFRYRVDLGYEPGRFTVTQAYVEVPGVHYLGNVRFGQFTPPIGLQTITSSWDIGFMEPAAPLQALAPSSQPGVQAGDTFLDRRATWALGLFAGVTTDGEYGSGVKDFGTLVGRATWLAIDQPERPGTNGNRFLHFGLSGSVQYSGSGELQYRSRPESYIAPHVIDTGTLQASRAGTVAGELLWVDGPFSAQAEIIRSGVNAETAGNLVFYGGYAMASWYLSGESRPYDRGDGTPGRLIPHRNFAFGPEGGWGAFEAGARLSYTDLSDGSVQGGRLTMFMTTLNWYLRPQLKCMFEVGSGRISGTASSGNLLLAQLRMGVYFY